MKQRHSRLVVGIWRIVPPLIVLDEQPEHVDAKARHAPAQPKAQHLVHGRHHLGVAPIEVGLLL